MKTVIKSKSVTITLTPDQAMQVLSINENELPERYANPAIYNTWKALHKKALKLFPELAKVASQQKLAQELTNWDTNAVVMGKYNMQYQSINHALFDLRQMLICYEGEKFELDRQIRDDKKAFLESAFREYGITMFKPEMYGFSYTEKHPFYNR